MQRNNANGNGNNEDIQQQRNNNNNNNNNDNNNNNNNNNQRGRWWERAILRRHLGRPPVPQLAPLPPHLQRPHVVQDADIIADIDPDWFESEAFAAAFAFGNHNQNQNQNPNDHDNDYDDDGDGDGDGDDEPMLLGAARPEGHPRANLNARERMVWHRLRQRERHRRRVWQLEQEEAGDEPPPFVPVEDNRERHRHALAMMMDLNEMMVGDGGGGDRDGVEIERENENENDENDDNDNINNHNNNNNNHNNNNNNNEEEGRIMNENENENENETETDGNDPAGGNDVDVDVALHDEFDDAFDDLIVDMFRNGGHGQRSWGWRISALRAARGNVSSTLFFMVQEGRTCTSVLSGWGISEQGSCQSIVEHCRAHREEANYVCRQGRMPLHEACLRGACRHVIQALLDATDYRGAMDRDQRGNTPLHLLFVDSSSSFVNNSNIVWSPEYLAGVVEDLMARSPGTIACSANADGDTPLHAACMAPETMVDPRTIVRLLEANPRAAIRMNTSNQTPLRLHCQRRNASPEVAALLVNHNPDALIVLDHPRGWAPIHAAASNANFRLLRYLVEANPEAVKVRTLQRQTALHLLCQHHTHLSSPSGSNSNNKSNSNKSNSNNKSSTNTNTNINYNSNSNYNNNNNNNHHHHHHHHGQADRDYSEGGMVTGNGGSSSSSSNNQIRTTDVIEAVELLLEADPEAVLHQDTTHGQTPLHLVCKTEGSREVPLPVVRHLLRCNPRAAAVPDARQYLPLHYACERGCSPEVVRALLEAHPDAAMALTQNKDTALSLACTCNKSPETVLLLIRAHEAALKEPNDYGFCPLHCVCRAHQPRMGIVNALLEACPESARLRTSSGKTALQLAESNSGTFAGVLQLLAQTENQLRMRETMGSDGNDNGNDNDTSNKNSNNNNNNGINELEEGGKIGSLSCSRAMAGPMTKTESFLSVTMGDVTKKDADKNTNNKNNNKKNEDEDMGHQFHDTLDVLNNNYRNNYRTSRTPGFSQKNMSTNKKGNTPLHDACNLGKPYENLEAIAKANPEYIQIRNNAGLTPLQILCKNGRIDERIISTFAQMGGPDIFSVKDANGNTPLHSAMRNTVDVASLRCLIRASPDALRSRTTYGDTPLHLACLRKCSDEVVREVAMAASSGDVLPALVPNLAAQTPIGIAMAEFRGICQEGNGCCISASYRPDQMRVFDVLSTLVKIVYYGPLKCQQQGMKNLSLLRACVVLHRQNLRLDPAFIRQTIHMYPEEVKLMDEDGNYPLHIEASIPIEKMMLLEGTCSGKSHSRMGILRILLEAYPHACSVRNKQNQFPLGLMINAGRLWGHTIAVALRAFPPALHWYKGVDDRFCSLLLEKASKECGVDTLFSLLVSRPGLFDATSTVRDTSMIG